jgi:tetratricopeptide (TPR) repeat protein
MFENASDSYRHYIAIALEEKERGAQAKGYAGLGMAYQRLGQFDEAMELYQKSLDIFKNEVGCDRLSEALAYEKLAKCSLEMGRIDEGIMFTQKK